MDLSRRDFVKTAVAGSLAVGAGGLELHQGHLSRGLVYAVGDGDAHAFVRQLQGNSSTDTSTSTCDHGHAVSQRHSLSSSKRTSIAHSRLVSPPGINFADN
jgi:hypothetical protein